MIIYDEPAATYHANKALGSTDIRDYLRSPRLFKDRQEGLIMEKETPAQRFGTLVHMAVLEPERFAAEVVAKPEGMSFATKEGKAWRDAHEGAAIITEGESAALYVLKSRMPAEVARMLRQPSGRAEATFRTEIHGLPVQCRPDYWDVDGNVKYDFKTINAIEKVDRAIWQYGYHVQDRWYSRVMGAELGRKPPMSRMVFAETSAPYRWRVVDLDVDAQMMADNDIDRAVLGIVERNRSGDWSDPEDLYYVASPPAWMAEDDETTEGEE